jgi:hypothetical protein
MGQTARPPWRRRRSLKGRGVLDQLPEFRGQEVNRGLLANDVAEHNRTQQVPRCGFEAEAGRPSANPDVTGNQRLVAAAERFLTGE